MTIGLRTKIAIPSAILLAGIAIWLLLPAVGGTREDPPPAAARRGEAGTPPSERGAHPPLAAQVQPKAFSPRLLTVRAVDIDGNAAADAEVRVESPDFTGYLEATTNSEGLAILEIDNGVSSASIRVRADPLVFPPAVASAQLPAGDCFQLVTLAPYGRAEFLAFRIQLTGDGSDFTGPGWYSFSHVRSDPGAFGTGRSGGSVAVHPLSFERGLSSIVYSATGSVAIELSVEGFRRVWFETKAAPVDSGSPATVKVAVDRGASVFGEIGLSDPSGRSISGPVWAAAIPVELDSHFNLHAPGVATSPMGVRHHHTQRQDGPHPAPTPWMTRPFEIRGLTKGRYRVAAVGPEGDFLSQAVIVEVEDKPAGPYRLLIRAGPTVRIRVLLGGKPFPLSVILTKIGAGCSEIRTARANREGVATFEAVAPGTYAVSTNHQTGFHGGEAGDLGGILDILATLSLPSSSVAIQHQDVDMGTVDAMSGIEVYETMDTSRRHGFQPGSAPGERLRQALEYHYKSAEAGRTGPFASIQNLDARRAVYEAFRRRDLRGAVAALQECDDPSAFAER